MEEYTVQPTEVNFRRKPFEYHNEGSNSFLIRIVGGGGWNQGPLDTAAT
jgi:hypothetical protein